jgi:hypothetical protein
MAMSLAALEILEQAQFPPAQARAIARVLEAEGVARNEGLVTRSDLARLESSFGGTLQQMGSSFDVKLQQMESSFDVKLQKMESRLDVKIESVKTDCVRWTFLAMAGQATMLAGLMYFMLQNLR